MARIQTALTPTQLNHKRGTAWRGTQYVSISRPALVFQATISQTPTGDAFADVHYTAVSGGYSAIQAGMTVQIGANFLGRVRKSPTSDILYINETSQKIQQGDSIRVWDDYRVFGILGRMVNGVEVIDWDQSYQGLRPMIRNLSSVAVGWVSASTDDKLQLSFAPTAHATEHGATINHASWQWELPSGVTLQTGTLTQPNITVRCEAGEHWLHVSVADDGGRTSTRHIKIFAHGESFPPETRVDEISVEIALEGGVNATIPSFAGMDDLPDGTMVTVWTDCEYDGVSVPTRIDAHGRLSRTSSGAEGDFQYHVIPQNLTAQISGVAGQMSAIEAPKVALQDNPAPSAWGAINRPTLWRAIWHVLDRYSTITTLHEIAFDDLSDAYIHSSPFAVGGGQLLSALNGLLSAINGGLQFGVDGVIECVRDGRWLSADVRDGLGVVASWDERDALSYDAEHESGGKVGFIQAFGATWHSASQKSTPFSAIAPGVAFDRGDTSATLNEQVLRSNVPSSVAQAELIERAGHEFAFRNGGDSLTVNLPDGYSDLTPARNIWHVWTLAELPTQGERWLLTRLSYRHDNETGARDVQATFERETIGTVGQALVLPPADHVENMIPTFPPFDVYPAFPEMPDVVFPSNDIIHIPPVTISPLAPNVPPRDGNVVMTWNDFDVWLTDDYKKSNSPSWTRITPPFEADEIIQEASFGKGVEAFVLTYDTVRDTSRVWRTDDVFVGGVWKAGDAVAGKFDLLRVAPPPDTLYLAGQLIPPPEPSEWEQIFNFREGMHGWAINRDTPAGSLTYVSGSGFKFISPASGWDERLLLAMFNRPTRVSDNRVQYVEMEVTERNLSVATIFDPFSAITIPAGTTDTTESKVVDAGAINYLYAGVGGTKPPAGETFTLSKLTYKGTGINPFQLTPSWVQTYDFTTSSHGFVASGDLLHQELEWLSGLGWRQLKTNGVRVTGVFTLTLPTPIGIDDYIITKVRVEGLASDRSRRFITVSVGATGQASVGEFGYPDTAISNSTTDFPLARQEWTRITFALDCLPTTGGINPTGTWAAITKLTIEGISKAGMGNPLAPPAQALIAYSDDNGATITTQALGDPPLLGMIGLDTVTIGNSAYVGRDGDILRAEDDNTPVVYASLPAGAGVAGGLIVAPRYKENGDSNAIDDPDLIVASPVLSDDEAVWRITDEGDTLTDITPEISGDYGVIASPNSLAVAWQDPERMAVIAVIDDEKHLMTWGGSAWVDRGVLGDDADYVRMRKQDNAGRELYFVDGECYYSSNYGAKLTVKRAPETDMKGISVYG